MPDMKSMLPDLKEVTSIASKLFKDVKKSVTEIIDEYKEKHCTTQKDAKSEQTSTEKQTKEKKAKPTKEEK